MKPKLKPKWPTITVEAPENLMPDMLRYWDHIFTSQKGFWQHPEDKKARKQYRAAIKTLLPFFES